MDFDFTKHQKVEKLDAVPKDFQGLYVEADGDGEGFVLDSDNPQVKSAVSAITRLNKALKSERRARKDATEKTVDLSGLSEFGTTIEEIVEGVQTKISEVSKQKGKASEADIQKQVEKIKKEAAKQTAKEVENRDGRISALTHQLYKQMVEAKATAALADVAVDVELVMPFVIKQVKVEEEDGEFKVRVIDEDGTRYGANGPMTIRELVEEMKGNPKFHPLFKSEAKDGSGTIPGSTVRMGMPRKGEKLSPNQKIAVGIGKHQHGSGRAAAARGPG